MLDINNIVKVEIDKRDRLLEPKNTAWLSLINIKRYKLTNYPSSTTNIAKIENNSLTSESQNGLIMWFLGFISRCWHR